ncbi:hypothetical protein CAPTEDRAFT_211057 [Capitella teleta]|uniref:Tryptophan--tRNA ligase, mitochondrial n=1 Tax=Capitella teleta TaxID=283909 RepID=R7VE99_CAPTE|nr:hypothetical protein CAPTEDRAFT_211057 [Capitella teleta]|eukprot:ELU14621.1 hypothetical protein CAPTEDRAFT_211057 [Capitella teleta]
MQDNGIKLAEPSVNACVDLRKDTAEKSSEKPERPRRIFSGIQPTGVPHIGNYFGAIKPWVEMQERYGNIILSVVDLHSITVPHQPRTLRQNIRSMVACLLACGIDPDRTILFQQSSVHQHAELAWVLGCLTTMPRLQHLPQWKQKSESMKEVPLGLFTYPVLQAADILLYKATDVPVGDDQVKHIELARVLARTFNAKFGYTFPEPTARVGEYKRLKSLRNPMNKMSKSDPDPKSRIDLNDSPEDIRNKFKKAVSDSTPMMTYDPELRPGVSNLIDIEAAFRDAFSEEITEEVMFLDTLALKTRVAEVVVQQLETIRKEFVRIDTDKGYVEEVLKKGQMKATEIAEETYAQVKAYVGLS